MVVYYTMIGTLPQDVYLNYTSYCFGFIVVSGLVEVIVAKQFTVGGSSCDCNQNKNLHFTMLSE